MFLRINNCLSSPKLMESLNGNIYYQVFCAIGIRTENQLTSYKLIDSCLHELSKKLKIKKQQKVL